MNKNQFKVSVIVISWNTRELTLRCLDSIAKHVDLSTYEVIVVDNASSDGSLEAMRAHFPWVQLYSNSNNLGFAAAVNQGIARSRGEFIILFNSDACLKDDAFQVTLQYFQENPSIGALGCRVSNSDGSHQPTAARFPNLFLDFSDHFLRPLSFLPAGLRQNCIHRHDFPAPKEIDWVAGSCMVLRRKAVDEVCGFDEQFFFSEEDIDICYRLKKRGWRVVYFPLASVVHFSGQSRALNPSWPQHFFMGRYRFYEKHRSSSYAFLFRVLILMSIGLRWFATWLACTLGVQHLNQLQLLYRQHWEDILRWPARSERGSTSYHG